jgi:hypothetical protein
MTNPGIDSRALLTTARLKAQRLLEELKRQQQEIEQSPQGLAKLSAEDLAQGREAMQKAIEAAGRAVESLDQAIQMDACEDELQ